MDSQSSARDDFLGAARLLWRRRFRVAAIAGAAVVAAAAVSMIVPHGYTARATFLATQDDQGSIAGQLAAAGSLIPAALLAMPSTPIEVFREILESRAVRRGVVHSLGLIERFDLSDLPPHIAEDAAIGVLNGQMQIAQKRSGWMAVETSFSTPWFPFLHEASDDSARALSARVANETVRQLNIVLRERRSSSARNTRVYLEEEMAKNASAMSISADSLVAFQRRHAMISLEDQARVTIETLGVLKGEIVAKEVELDVVRRERAHDSFELRRVQSELAALEGRYSELVRGNPLAEAALSPRNSRTTRPQQADVYLAMEDLPELAMELLRRKNEVQLHATVHELLTQQFYHARLEEARDTPTVQILDEAIPPIRKTTPQRRLIVAISLLAGVVLGSVWVLATDRSAVSGLRARP